MRILLSLVIAVVIAFNMIPKIVTKQQETKDKKTVTSSQTQQTEPKQTEPKQTEPKQTKAKVTKTEQAKPTIKSPKPKPVVIQQNNFGSQLAHLESKAPSLRQNVLKLALTAYHKAFSQGGVKKQLLTVIDYSLPSNKQRMWVFDVKNEKLLYNTYVAHGKNSGSNVPNHFSNQPSSKESSLGTYVTKDTYYGSKGLSLNLKGLEQGFNDNAYNRRVVIHGAWYVEPSFIKSTGYAGRSWGCPSIAKTLAAPIINTLKGGSVVFAYYPDSNYLKKSSYVA